MKKLLGPVSLVALTAAIGFGVPGAATAASPPLLLQHPSLSQTQIAFDYGGEIWTVPRGGGQAQVIVIGQGQSSGPIFSPDGRWIAYTGRYDGNTDVYVVPAAGGEPRRLTWHPREDVAVGWTPDGQGILFHSQRAALHPHEEQFYVVPVEGGAPTAVPLPSGNEGAYSPDGTHLAYTPFSQWQPAWKHYRGGQTERIWIADLSDSHIDKVPRANSNDEDPMWVGGALYFLSDRDGPVALYAYDLKSHAVSTIVANPDGFDIKSAQAGPGGIVYDQFGALKIYDFASGQSRAVPVTINADLPQVRPHFETVKPRDIQHTAITATGKRVLIEARGEILSVPAEKGDVRNLTQSPGVAERAPAASPDGKSVAWFSDESGEYALHIRSADGLGPVTKLALPPSFYFSPRWSPDSRKIIFSDKKLNLWIIDVAKGSAPVRIDADLYDTPDFRFGTEFQVDAAWSPDSRWVVYTKQLPNHLHAAWVCSVDTGKATQITDGLSDVAHARFDHSGDYLYFTATTSTGLSADWLYMSNLGRAVDGAVYAVVLRKDATSPVAPQSDEEETEPATPDGGDRRTTDAAKAGAKHAEPYAKAVEIDFDHLDQRIVALPIARANFTGLETGKDGVVYVLTSAPGLTDGDYLEGGGETETLFRFDLKSRKNVQFADGVQPGSFDVSADGSTLLYSQKGAWVLVGGEIAPKPGEGRLKLDGVSVWVDPRAEWRQIYNEAWRIERDFLYDPNLQGLNLKAAERVYAPFVDGLGGRQDLNALLEEMTGHIGVGHLFVHGGDMLEEKTVEVGLLGADYEVVDGRFRIRHILRGDSWNSKLVAPLSQPGVKVSEGEFLLAVNGKEVHADTEVYRAFEGLAGKQTVITVGPRADGTGSRQITVVPIDNETPLRLRSWMEANRRKVDELSGGKLAYIYLPDTSAGGFANFNRYYYAQVGKQGAVVDERFNQGGNVADYIVDELKRAPQMIRSTREGESVVEPSQAIYGPKVMIINQLSGSGGDALPWLFKKGGVGPLVGVRTWGGLVGLGYTPPFIDGGMITAPHYAIYGTTGQWEVENIGVAPDIEVGQDPALIRNGHDPQLEAAVAVAMKALAASPPPIFPKAVYPDRKPVLPDGRN